MWMALSWLMDGRVGRLRGLLFLGGLVWVAAASPAWAEDEGIRQFDSRIEVQTNGTLAVVETIEVNALGQAIRHGIYRDFPQLYQTFFGLRFRTTFIVQSVRRDGQSEPFHLDGLGSGERVYIGSADTFIEHGHHTYELVYTTDRQLGFFPDHDELYWNVTGNGWVFPIDAVTATVALPAGATATNLTAYTGAQGEHGRDFTAFNYANTAHFTTTQTLPARNGLTIVVEWPKGFVKSPLPAEKWLALLADNPGLLLGLGMLGLVGAYYLVAGRLVTREPPRGVVAPRCEPPDGLSPAAARHLWRMGFDNRGLAAAILDLAVKGRIKIEEIKLPLQKRFYVLVHTRAKLPELPAEESVLLQDLDNQGRPLELKPANAATLQAARKQLKAGLARAQQGRLFVNHWRWCLPGLIGSLLAVLLPLHDVPRLHAALFALVWLSVWTVGTVFLLRMNRFMGVFFALFWFFGAWLFGQFASWWEIGIIAAGIWINVRYYYRFKTHTPAGRRLMDQVEGFKQYLAGREPARPDRENPLAGTPEQFETFLPYALALGVERPWSESFTAVLSAAEHGGRHYAPDWYDGPGWNHLAPAGFATSLGGAFAGAVASAAAPGSSGGAGGSSGGGGGGGGGGGW